MINVLFEFSTTTETTALVHLLGTDVVNINTTDHNNILYN